MKITIELSEQQVKGIKQYLKETDACEVKITKADVVQYIHGIVHATLELPQESVSDYIKAAGRI